MDDEVEKGPLSEAIARALAPGQGLEEVTRPLLEVLQRVTGLESTYLTVIHWEDFKQEILYSHNKGDIEVSEGLLVSWADTLCRRALHDGRHHTPDAVATWGSGHGGVGLGIVTYASVPVMTADRTIYGTLCAASSERRDLRASDIDLMKLLARLVGAQVDREQALARERRLATAGVDRARPQVMLVAAAEHRIKTPLTVISAVAQTLLDRWGDVPDPTREEMVDTVVRRCDELMECVEVLLAQARTEAGVLDLDPRAVVLDAELRRIAADFANVSASHVIEVRCPPHLICVADPGALGQVLGHLVDNAIKYTDGGRILLAAELDRRFVTITVLDSGPGLPSEDLFEPFRRGADDDAANGSGLGLYVVRTLLEGMRGSIVATDGPSGGARFRITLPAG